MQDDAIREQNYDISSKNGMIMDLKIDIIDLVTLLGQGLRSSCVAFLIN
jgi:hypothetical protein